MFKSLKQMYDQRGEGGGGNLLTAVWYFSLLFQLFSAEKKAFVFKSCKYLLYTCPNYVYFSPSFQMRAHFIIAVCALVAGQLLAQDIEGKVLKIIRILNMCNSAYIFDRIAHKEKLL